ncbi:hypothetical protein [Tunturibacter empetritectus]|uniref:Glycosyltransferase RgtA/B/C/D-like domain-containing protein n=1 Tax=Tunturiibacter empetritectus TaxID=3069691 RepID=A0A7W8IL82_9BACT|nr:hypothetical protein [Edaphobacter lichenicola]MBB5319265.1 hypothetical protein [Edaphobacter lichenicola]
MWLLGIYGAIGLSFLAIVPKYFLPAEDAMILFAYSRNLALHGVITFFAGGPRTEGATDFAWMALVAGAMRVGLDPYWFSAMVNVGSLLGLAVVLLRMARIRISTLRVLTIAGSVALFPQIFAAAAGFAVLPDALLLATVTLLVIERRVAWASLGALVFCLFRPDGVVFVLPLLAYAVVSSKEKRVELGRVAAFFLVPGIAYFAWRVHYFGELFPLPFLVKSDARRVLGLVVAHSMQQSLKYLLFDAAVLMPGILLRGLRPKYLFVSLIAAPTAFYWMMRLDQNIGDRFFYYLPLAAAILLAIHWEQTTFSSRRTVLGVGFVAWLFLIAMPFYRELRTFRDMQFHEAKGVAQELSATPEHGSMVTTEAGFLPYYSGWTTYDPWGLNTPEFAHRFVQPEDVERLRADVIVVHPDQPESCLIQPGWQTQYAGRTWPNLSRNLVIGVKASRYELWLVSYGSEFYRQRRGWRYGEGDRECWFLLRDSPHYSGIAEALGRHHGVGPPESIRLEREHALHAAQ